MHTSPDRSVFSALFHRVPRGACIAVAVPGTRNGRRGLRRQLARRYRDAPSSRAWWRAAAASPQPTICSAVRSRRSGSGRRHRRAADHDHRQRPSAPRRRDEAGDAGVDAALQAWPHRHQARMRPRRVRRLHCARRRRAPLFVLAAHPHGARATGRDDRRAGGGGWHSAPGAARDHRRAGLSMRVLHVRLHHGLGGIPEDEPQRPRGRSSRTASRATCAGARTTTRSSPR